MAQVNVGDWNIVGASTDGDELTLILNRLYNAYASENSGTTAPPSPVTGTRWLDTSSGTTHVLKQYNTTGTVWTEVFSVTVATGAIIYPEDTTKLDATNPTALGTLTVHSTSPFITMTMPFAGGLASYAMKDSAGQNRLLLTYDDGTGTVSMARFSSGGALQAKMTLGATDTDFNGPVNATDYTKVAGVVVASLPSASTAGAGARAFVTDATATTFNSTVAGSGANNVPVFSDGTNWKIG